MREIPPNRKHPIQGVVIIKIRVVNEAMDRFLSLPNGSEKPRYLE